MEKDFYVYIYYRLDTNEPFYVGKGQGNRWNWLYNRNDHFTNIVNSTPIAVEIFKDNLTEDEAHGIECYLIHELVFEYGFSIDIKNNRSIDETHYHLATATWGGEGTSGYTHTEETIQKISENRKGKNCGEDNHMHNKTVIWDVTHPHPRGMLGKTHTEESRNKIGEASKGNCNMLGKTHTEKWKQDMSERMSGENNPFCGKNHTEESKNKISKTRIEKGLAKGENNPMFGRLGDNNPNAKSVINLTTKRIFLSVKSAEEYYNVHGVSRCCKGKSKSCGKLEDGTKLVWRRLNHNHNITLRGKDISKLHTKREVA